MYPVLKGLTICTCWILSKQDGRCVTPGLLKTPVSIFCCPLCGLFNASLTGNPGAWSQMVLANWSQLLTFPSLFSATKCITVLMWSTLLQICVLPNLRTEIVRDLLSKNICICSILFSVTAPCRRTLVTCYICIVI